MIFAGGYNLKKKDFGKNFIYIITYGLLGTLLVFGIVFGLTYAVSELRWIIPLRAEEGIECCARRRLLHVLCTWLYKYTIKAGHGFDRKVQRYNFCDGLGGGADADKIERVPAAVLYNFRVRDGERRGGNNPVQGGGY